MTFFTNDPVRSREVQGIKYEEREGTERGDYGRVKEEKQGENITKTSKAK